MLEQTYQELEDFLRSLKSQVLIFNSKPNHWAGCVVQYVEYWFSVGVYSVEDFKRHCMERDYWNLYKDLYGIRPRCVNFKEMSNEDLEAELKNLSSELEESHAEDGGEAELEAELDAWYYNKELEDRLPKYEEM